MKVEVVPPDELRGSYGDGATVLHVVVTASEVLVYCLVRMQHTSLYRKTHKCCEGNTPPGKTSK